LCLPRHLFDGQKQSQGDRDLIDGFGVVGRFIESALSVLPCVAPALGRDALEKVADVDEPSKGEWPRLTDSDRLGERPIPARLFRHSIINPPRLCLTAYLGPTSMFSNINTICNATERLTGSAPAAALSSSDLTCC
ncbi:MAG: hypothetical protein WCD52_23195, partial [Xanthobacteraceae bacterium]